MEPNSIIESNESVLITGATGFIGQRVLENLLERGHRRLVCFARPLSESARIASIAARYPDAKVDIVYGNLQSKEDCVIAAKDAAIIIHLAAGGDRSYPDAVLNCVVTTRNLLDAALQHGCLRRFVNVSSLAVYTNAGHSRGRLLDESCPIETHAEQRCDPYAFAKVMQDQLVEQYNRDYSVPYVIVRPGYVIGPYKPAIPSRVGIDTFGVFLHLGASNKLPLTYVDNCADAIVLAALTPGVEGMIFNIVDDDLPSSRSFLRAYKRHVKKFRTIYVPRFASHALCSLWEKYSRWSDEQLPPVFNSKRWHVYWKKTRYTNQKLKATLGWAPKVPMKDAMQRYFTSCRSGESHA